jgi:hypothetical protein
MATPQQEIDLIIESAPGWKAELLTELRSVILGTNPSVDEAVKWKMPSKPLGSAVWESVGIICVADILKSAVRLTFPNAAKFAADDPHFNARLDSKVVRAIDYFENDVPNHVGLQNLVSQAISFNLDKGK